jgi:hypothetical protein
MCVLSHLTLETKFSFRNVVYLKQTLNNGQCLTKYVYDLESFTYILFLLFPFMHISFPFLFVLYLKVWTCQVRLTSNAICQTQSNFIHCKCITYTHTINHIPSRILYHTHAWELIVQMKNVVFWYVALCRSFIVLMLPIHILTNRGEVWGITNPERDSHVRIIARYTLTLNSG